MTRHWLTPEDLRTVGAVLPRPDRAWERLRRSIRLADGARDNAYDELYACHLRATERRQVAVVLDGLRAPVHAPPAPTVPAGQQVRPPAPS